jgi:4-amino-4-deoxy-L-arabinose transferase-like glycosyltransferase
MGKYIFSLGNAGLWEASRPIIWPLILGFFWKLNLDVILFGKIISLIFSVGVLLMTYLIAKVIFDKKIALLSTLLLAFTSTFFFFSKLMLSGIVSTFFILVAIYFFIKKRYFLFGIFFGIGFMTRFLHLIPFLVIIVILFLYSKKNKTLAKNLVKIGLGFIIPIFPYLLLNFLLYQNIFYPFLLQVFLTKTTGLSNYQSLLFYPLRLFINNFLYLFFIPGAYYLFKKKLSMEKSLLLYLSLIPFMFFISIKHKEMRFLIMFLPFLYIIAAYGIIKFFGLIKSRDLKITLFAVFSGLFIFNAFSIISVNESIEIRKENNFFVFQNYIAINNLGKVWTSSPLYTVYFDKKVEIIYYPTFDNEKMASLLSNKGVVLLDTCNIWCDPNSNECSTYKEDFMTRVKNNFETKYYNKDKNCEQYILVRK